jgi:hypothetical protein
MAGADTKPAATPAAGAETEGVLSRLSGLAWQALPAIGSAAGLAGFVAVIGSAVELIRFHAAKLPETQAVLAVPRAELVLVGAIALAAYFGAGLLAVLVVYLIDNNGNATVATVRAIVGVGLIEMGVTIAFINAGPWWTYLWLYVWLLLLGFVSADLAGEIVRNFRARTKLRQAGSNLVEARDKLIAAEAALATAEEIKRNDKPWILSNAKSRKAIEAQAQAELAVASARREWEKAIREWSAATEAIGGLPKDAQDEIGKARTVVGGYLHSPPKGDALADQVAKAEEDTGHVVYAVRARLRVQVSHLRPITRIWMGLIVAASKVLEGFKAVSSWAERLDAGKRRDARDRRLAASAPARRGVRPAAAGAEATPADATKGTAAAVLTAIVVTVMGGLVVTGIVLIVVEDLLSWFAIAFVVVVALTAVNVFVARVTEKFAWYGITVFFSVLIFGATLTIARTLHSPKAQPIALIRKGDDVGVCGVYIAQTSDRVYIGRPAVERQLAVKGRPAVEARPGLIFWVPTGDVDLVSVGQPKHVEDDFESSAVAMLTRLYMDRAKAAGASLKNPTITEERVDSKTGVKTTETREEERKPAKEKSKVGVETPSSATTGYPVEELGKTCTAPSKTKTQ